MVYVLNWHSRPLMPCSERRARLLLRAGKARVLHRLPFTIGLTGGASGYRQEVVAALDTGSAVVGSAAVSNGRVVYQAEVILRNDISGKLQARASFRRTRRGHKTRYRQPRFDNRSASRRKGRLAPSLHSKIESHLREVRAVEALLPVTSWVFELASFDIHKITNPDVSGAGYQAGALKDYYNIKQYVLARDNYRCQSGRKVKHDPRLHVHHRVFRSEGGGDAPGNLTTLCETCHKALHAGLFALPVKATRSATKHATEIGIIKSRLRQCAVPYTQTFGYETKYKREQVLKWEKTHSNDAIAACLQDDELALPMASILVKRHIASGDYKQTYGPRSERRKPTGKLFGLRKGDKVSTPRGVGFVQGKRSSGYFAIADLDGTALHASEKVANCHRMTAHTTTQIEGLPVARLLLRRAAKVLSNSQKTAKATTASQSALYLPGMNAEVSRAIR